MIGKSAFTQATTTLVYDRMNYFGLYLQDNWKLTSRLTVSAGLRWDPTCRSLPSTAGSRTSIRHHSPYMVSRTSLAGVTRRGRHSLSRGMLVVGFESITTTRCCDRL
jgi:outer membrane receptor protein involved in Fe transport